MSMRVDELWSHVDTHDWQGVRDDVVAIAGDAVLEQEFAIANAAYRLRYELEHGLDDLSELTARCNQLSHMVRAAVVLHVRH